jgi:hypothetical protein
MVESEEPIMWWSRQLKEISIYDQPFPIFKRAVVFEMLVMSES